MLTELDFSVGKASKRNTSQPSPSSLHVKTAFGASLLPKRDPKYHKTIFLLTPQPGQYEKL